MLHHGHTNDTQRAYELGRLIYVENEGPASFLYGTYCFDKLATLAARVVFGRSVSGSLEIPYVGTFRVARTRRGARVTYEPFAPSLGDRGFDCPVYQCDLAPNDIGKGIGIEKGAHVWWTAGTMTGAIVEMTGVVRGPSDTAGKVFISVDVDSPHGDGCFITQGVAEWSSSKLVVIP